MINEQKILAIIPARGGSKGIPKKNIKILFGKPLIVYTIEAALKSKYLNKIVVSTDDEEISRISKNSGVKVIKRPKKLARDDSPIMEAVRHSLRVLKHDEKYEPGIVVILQATSPLRKVSTIDLAIKKFLEKIDKYDSLIPLFPIEGKSGKIKNEFYEPDYSLGANRQQVGLRYKECGTIFILKTDLIIKEDDFGKNIYPFIIKDPKEAHDIDTLDDFMEAECFLGCKKR